MKITERTHNDLRFIKRATNLPMTTILEGLVSDHMAIHQNRYQELIRWKKTK